jgi:hypothetical protein
MSAELAELGTVGVRPSDGDADNLRFAVFTRPVPAANSGKPTIAPSRRRAIGRTCCKTLEQFDGNWSCPLAHLFRWRGARCHWLSLFATVYGIGSANGNRRC